MPKEAVSGAIAIMDYCLGGWAYLGTSEAAGLTGPERILEERVIRLAAIIDKIPGKKVVSSRIYSNQWCGIKSREQLDKVLAAYKKQYPGCVRMERTGKRGPATETVYAPGREVWSSDV